MNQSSGNVIAGNFIGTNATGNAAIAGLPETGPMGQFDGVLVDRGASNRIGTNGDGVADEAERNVIAGLRQNGIDLRRTGDNIVAGNYVGTDVTGTVALPNLTGISINNQAQRNRIGTDGDGVGDAAESNVIAFNAGDGVRVSSGAAGNSIRGNSIHSNAELGIDLNATSLDDEVTPNDPGDIDTGGNELQNFPVLHAAVSLGPFGTLVVGQLRSMPGTTYVVDVYASSAADPSGFGQGERFLGSLLATTNAAGIAIVVGFLPAATARGEVLTATATDPAGNTSEFSAAVKVRGVPGRLPGPSPFGFVVAESASERRRTRPGVAPPAVVPAVPQPAVAADDTETDERDDWTLAAAAVASEPEIDPTASDPIFADLDDLGGVLELP